MNDGHTSARICRRRKGEAGYAILLVLFLVTLMVLATIGVAPNILTQGRREKEKEMIWRGKQYARGIKLYYRKTGKFPTSMDDLTKPKMGSIRFMRQAYKDPMNAKDGEWRLIYVGPTGQLIGSLKPAQTLQLSGLAGAAIPGTPAAQAAAQSAAGFGQAAGQGSANSGANSSAFNSTFGSTSQGQMNPPAQPNGPGQTTPPQGTDTPSSDSLNPSAAAGDTAVNEALLASEPTTVMGGNIIGVGSKVNQRSIAVYDKARNYKQFEFIWDPAKDAIVLGGAAGPQVGTPAVQPAESSPFGSPANPASNPNPPGGGGLQPQPGPPETTPPPPPQQP